MKIGKISENVLKRSVLRQIHTKREEVICGAGLGEDCAIFALSEDENMVSCVQEAAVTVNEEYSNNGFCLVSMDHLLTRCVNNIVTTGGEPLAVQIVILLPEKMREICVKELMKNAESACKKYGMQIVGGQTRVTAAVRVPFATVTAFGKAKKQIVERKKTLVPGHDIIISKWIGLEGTAYLAKANKERLLERYPAYLVEEAESFLKFLSVVPEAATAVKSGVCAMHDASEGGIFSALWELAEGAGVGLTIDLKKLPLRQETVEVCELLALNPYELRSGGCLVMTSEDGNGLVAALEAIQVPAVVVGKITDGNDRIILNEDEIRYMDRPKQDAIYQFMDQ